MSYHIDEIEDIRDRAKMIERKIKHSPSSAYTQMFCAQAYQDRKRLLEIVDETTESLGLAVKAMR